jgi:hypothetical protein
MRANTSLANVTRDSDCSPVESIDIALDSFLRTYFRAADAFCISTSRARASPRCDKRESYVIRRNPNQTIFAAADEKKFEK